MLTLLFSLLLTLGGVSPAWAQKALPYSYGFENNDLETEGWTTQNPYSSNTSEFGIYNYAYRSGSYGFRFSSSSKNDSGYDQYLISPELSGATYGLTVEFYYKASSSYGTETFKVGHSSSDSPGIEDFTWGEEISTNSTTYTSKSIELPAGTKYVAIHYYSEYQYRLYVDDFTFTAVEQYKKPTAFASTGYTATTATFNWTNGNDETAWQIAYSTTQGFDADGVTPVDVTTNPPYTLTGLTAETTYYARIRADYGSGNYSSWSDEISFTPSATINDGTQTNGYVPLYGYYMDNGNVQTQFVLPSTSLTDLTGLQITGITFYGTENTAGNLNQNTFEIYMLETANTTISSLVDWTTMEKVYTGSLTISDGKMAITLEDGFDYSGSNLLIGFKQTAGNKWVTTTWTGVTATGASYGGYGSTLSQQNFLPKMTFASAAQAAVKKPKSLAASSVATTTAELGWTNGSDETAWQIAYSTNTDFNPDSEGTKVNANANPFTLEELTAATTYYAYVRAEKSGEYSAWSNKVEFTTLAAGPVIGLSTTSHNFGIVSDADAQALTLTISNTGGAALTGLSVTASTGFTVTDTEGNALTATTIAASSTLTVKVKVSTTGQQDGTITINGTEIDAQTVDVSGYLLDNTKILETFASASSVSRWTVASGWTFNATTGAYSGTSSRVMTTPKISVSEGDVLAINAKMTGYYGSLTIKGSSDNGETWTAYTKSLTFADNFGSQSANFVLITIDDVPTTINKLQITGEYVYINVFNGFTYVNDPVLGLYSNEACTSAQTSPATKNFGFATEAQSQLYYIKNTGNGQIDLTINELTGFTAAVTDAELTEGESTPLTITMTATEGLHEGAVVVTAKNHDNNEVLGTFTVNLNGAITGSKNNVSLASAFPAGWQNNNWAISSGAARIWASEASDLITTTLRVAEGDKLLLDAKKYDEDSQLSYSYSSDNGTTWSEAVSLTSSLSTDYKIIAISGIPAGDVLMKFTGTYAYIRQIYGFEAVSEPILTFAAANYNFGMVSSATTTDAYTVKNEGTAKLENLSVKCNNSNFTIEVADNATEIDANSQVTFTVTLNTTNKGAQQGTVTVSGEDVASKTFDVRGYVVDNTKIYTTLTAKPDRWENSGWTFAANGATAGYSNEATLTSPKISISAGQTLAVSAKLQGNSNSYYVKVEGYDTDESNAGWTYSKTLSNDVLTSSAYSIIEINDIPTTVNRIRLVGKYAIVNGLNGFTYDDNDPEFSVFSDSEFASQITTGTATNAWGFINEDKEISYYIKNTGTGTMTLSKTDAPAGFTAALGKTSLSAGESTSLTVSMANNATSNEGYHTGDVVLTAKDNANNELGTFTVTSSGVVVGSKSDINFASLTDFPAGWEATNWSISSGKATANNYTAGTLTTGTFKVAEGESMVIEAKGNISYYTPSLTYQYSTDGGENWTNGTSTLSFTYASDYQVQAISDIAAADEVIIKFTGKYIDIDRLYGYTVVAKPVMALDKTADYDFGMQTAAAEYVITVTNSGTAEMKNLAAALETGTDYCVAITKPEGESTTTITDGKATVPVGQSAIITVTQQFDASKGLASLSDVLTISADDITSKTINLSGQTRDASKWYVDFASTIPSDFVENGSWTVSSGAAYLSSSTESSLISSPITLTAGEKILFDARNPYSGSLKVRYSLNGGISWSEYIDYSNDISTSSAFSSHEIDFANTSEVSAIVEFKGRYYVYLDNIYGGTLNSSAPMIQVAKSGTAVESGTTEAFGAILSSTTAEYTITNIGNGTLTITETVGTTGDATATVSATSLNNGQSATLTITMPVSAEKGYGDKEGTVTVTTSLGDFVINYTATALNPNALDEQFAAGSKPAGWYFDAYWKVSGQQAMQEDTATPQDLITEQLSVSGTNDALTFQAAKTGSSTATFNVYTSQDRIEWTAVDLSGITLTTAYQDITVKGLAEGDYYLKITGARVKVDNFKGWTKKNNTRDLYVTATSFPTATQNAEASISASATVTSLIADETGVYAKLFINGEAVATTDAADVALNGTKTFSMNYTLPATPGNYKAQIKVYYSDDTEAVATAQNDVKVYYVLDETVDPGTITAGTYDVQINHTYVSGWNTLCMPFDIDVATFFGTSSKGYAFTGYNAGVLSFSTVTTLTAGTPYLVYVDASDLAYVKSSVTDVELATTASTVQWGDATFRGTYAPVAAGGMTGKWGVTSQAKIAKGTAKASINGFRAYFELPEGAAPSLSFFDVTTGITKVIAADQLQGGKVYNLNGQQVENAKKGLYIVNGKKVVVK